MCVWVCVFFILLVVEATRSRVRFNLWRIGSFLFPLGCWIFFGCAFKNERVCLFFYYYYVSAWVMGIEAIGYIFSKPTPTLLPLPRKETSTIIWSCRWWVAGAVSLLARVMYGWIQKCASTFLFTLCAPSLQAVGNFLVASLLLPIPNRSIERAAEQTQDRSTSSGSLFLTTSPAKPVQTRNKSRCCPGVLIMVVNWDKPRGSKRDTKKTKKI